MDVELKGKNMSRKKVEENEIMDDDKREERKILKRILKREKSLSIEIVSRLVEEKKIEEGIKNIGKVKKIEMEERKVEKIMMMIKEIEVERKEIGYGVNIEFEEIDEIVEEGNLLKKGIVWVEWIEDMIKIGKMKSVENEKRKFIRMIM